jgi:signal transduction histidine kinase
MPLGQRRGRLAYKILFWFLIISLGPMGIVGYHLIGISQASLHNQILGTEKSLAASFAETVYKYISTYRDILGEAAALPEFSSGESGSQAGSQSLSSRRSGTLSLRESGSQAGSYLKHLLEAHVAVLELSILDSKGHELIRRGRFLGPSPELRNMESAEFFDTAMARGEFIGDLKRFQGIYPTVTIAVAMNGRGPRTTPTGVLAAKISLNGLSSMLAMEFPVSGKASAAVASPDGFLLAHSDPEKVYKPDAMLDKDILKILTTQVYDKGGGEMTLSNGRSFLSAYADVKDLGWVVYVQEPIEVAYQAADQMRAQIMRLLVWVIIAIVLLSLAVAGHITQPLRALKDAARKVGMGQFEDLPEVLTTNDEIGDLAQAFLSMSESLKEKTGELVETKQELERFNKTLEKRVESRTRELKAAQEELIKKERLAAIGQMASVVGHEIRNPLAVINNSIYFIKTKLAVILAGDAKAAKHVKIIESEIQQANSIINEILTYSRQRELQLEPVRLNDWLEELLSLYSFPPHIEVRKSFAIENPPVEIDPTEMQQAVRNLIGNAIEVMPEKGVMSVKTFLSSPRMVAIEISDTGSGIPPEALDKIFAPFFTTKARGTGLGLAVVKKAVDRHGGQVEVESQVGRGTIFRIQIPISQRMEA